VAGRRLERVGGVNVWSGFTVDDERGLVFCPVGSATFDFWGGDRRGDNLYADCLLVLDAATGKHVWHYQFTRHDLWDRDPPAPPNLVTIRRDGHDIPAVAQITKSGHVWVFRRETGEPLFPVEEVVVPTSDLAGEVTVPTQPLPLKPAPFARSCSRRTRSRPTPEAHRAVLEQFSRLRPHTPFATPSREGTIVFPGFDGGAEWGGARRRSGGCALRERQPNGVDPDHDRNRRGRPRSASRSSSRIARLPWSRPEGQCAAASLSLVDIQQRLTRGECWRS